MYRLLALIVVALAGVSYFTIDKEVALFFHEHRYDLFKPITALGNSAIYLVGGALLYLLYRNKRPDIAKKSLYIFLSVLISGILAVIPKILIGRPRPKIFFKEGLYEPQWLEFKSSFWSMPSGHATTAFAVGVGLALLYPRYRWLFIAFAALVAFSRVALTKHYPSDVLLGALIGGLTAWALYKRLFDAP